MSRWRPARLPAALAIPAAVAAALWASMLGWQHLAGARSVLDRIENPLADLRLVLAGARPAPPGIVIVAVDDATVAAEGGYPLDRARLAELVARLAAMGAKALALDILLVGPSQPRSDAALAGALAGLPHVAAAAGLFDGRRREAPDIPATVRELWPESAFASPDDTGFVNMATDGSGVPRHVPLLFQTSRGLMPGFVLRAAGLVLSREPVFSAEGLRLDGRTVPLDLGRHLPLRPLGPAGTVPTLSAEAILDGRADPAAVAGRLVLVGVTATAVGDTFPTAFDRIAPGVEILATGVASLLGGPRLRRDAVVRRVDAFSSVLAALAGSVLIGFAPLLLATSIAALSIAAWLGAAVLLFGEGLWISMALPLIGVLPPLVLVALLRQIVQRRSLAALARMEEQLRRFQPPLLVERLRRDPRFLDRPVERMAAILFIDLAGFTRLTEKRDPSDVGNFLRDYHSLVETVSTAHGGMVMNFMGDGAMILFGIPEASPSDAERAVAAAFALRAAVRDWIAGTGAGRGFLDVRLGAHRGPVMLSRLGHATHQQITVSGDNVNVAARLMEVGKAHGATLVVSRDLLDAAGLRDVPPPDETETVGIRGREEAKAVALWR